MTPLETALCAAVLELIKQLRPDDEAFHEWHNNHAPEMPTCKARAAFDAARKS